MSSHGCPFFTTLSALTFLLALLFPISTATTNTSLQASDTLNISIGIGIGIGIGVGGSPPAPEPGCALPPPPPPPPACAPAPPPPPPQPQFENEMLRRAYYVIQKFKKTITCDPKKITKTWNGFDLCSQDKYKGFYCDVPPDNKKRQRAIASIDFNGFRLCAPTVCGLVDRLPELALFHANSNCFAGTVPDLTHLRFLYELDFSNNLIAGPFPADILPLANLTFLDLRFNRFAGAVPPAAFRLRVDAFFLNNNGFGGALPSDLGRSVALYLTLANNGFTGPIPSSIGDACSTLREVLFLNNSLSGCLPPEIGRLKKATVFDAGFNRITGPIPHAFGCLNRVEQLNLAGNLLYGEVPEAVCRLGNLKNLSLSSNYFTSVAPSCWRLIHCGVLDVRNNCIAGFPAQRPPWECARFLSRPRPQCPSLSYAPCWLPSEKGGGTAVVPSRPPGPRPYMAYSAVVNRHAPP